MTIRINYTRKTSVTARNLAESLNTKRLRLTNSTWKGKANDLLINWGSTNLPDTNATVLNNPEAIAKSVNKLDTFYALEDVVDIPVFADLSDLSFVDKLGDIRYLYDQDHRKLVLRSTVTGYGGQGITILDLNEVSLADLAEPHWRSIIEQTQLITVYFNAKDEYRVHVIANQPVFVQRKGLRTDDQRPENPDFHVRNHANGFIFQQNNINPPPVVLQASVDAIKAIGLQFGAVDIRYNPNTETYAVLEINSAPALTGKTLEVYTDTFNLIHDTLQG